jgi:hypothetical protein
LYSFKQQFRKFPPTLRPGPSGGTPRERTFDSTDVITLAELHSHPCISKRAAKQTENKPRKVTAANKATSGAKPKVAKQKVTQPKIPKANVASSSKSKKKGKKGKR